MNAADTSLDALRIGQSATVKHLSLDAHDSSWLRAVGLCEGRAVTVLRRGLLGGPLHVRLGRGGEFAVDRRLARSIAVEVNGHDGANG